jgi:hypothetical protein
MIRRLVFSALVLTALASTAAAQVHVDGYFRRDGTYVQPHYRSNPNGSTADNWSTRGNVNPYTGQVGTRDPYATTNPYLLPRSRYGR